MKRGLISMTQAASPHLEPHTKRRISSFQEKNSGPTAKILLTPPGAYSDLAPRPSERLFGESVCRLAQAPCEFFHDAHGDLGISFNRRLEVPEWHYQGLRIGFRRDHCGGPRLLINESHLSKKLASTQLRNQLLSLTDFD